MTPSASTLASAALLVGRLFLAALFLLEGWSKLRGYAPAAAYMEQFGVPGQLLPLVIAAEIGGGLCLALGWQARGAAVALAGFCLAAAVLFHGNITDRNPLLHFEKDVAIAGGLLVLAASGGGAWSLERFLLSRRGCGHAGE